MEVGRRRIRFHRRSGFQMTYSAASSSSFRAAVVAIAFELLLPHLGVAQQDVIAVGTGKCVDAIVGSTVTVPIFIRDAGGTTLGNDVPIPGHSHSTIQAISFQIRVTPINAIRTKTIERAGLLLGHQPMSELYRQTSDTLSFFAVFDEQRDHIPFSPGSNGDLIANAKLELNPQIPASRITLTIDPSPRVTILSDVRGELFEDSAHELRVSDGCVSVTAGRQRAVRR